MLFLPQYNNEADQYKGCSTDNERRRIKRAQHHVNDNLTLVYGTDLRHFLFSVLHVFGGRLDGILRLLQALPLLLLLGPGVLALVLHLIKEIKIYATVNKGASKSIVFMADYLLNQSRIYIHNSLSFSTCQLHTSPHVPH